KSHQPVLLDFERLWKWTCKPSWSTAKLATGLGVITRFSSEVTLVVRAPQMRPASVPIRALNQPDTLEREPLAYSFSSTGRVLLDSGRQGGVPSIPDGF